jgi:predicted nucleotidyltransferase
VATADPTIYPELNEVLRDLVTGSRAVLGRNFCGAYLQGSFAVGDADAYSDVDFLIVTHEEVSSAQLARLQAMHARIYGLDITWAQHLEGSYVPTHALRRLDPARAPWLYLDNGSTQLIWADHDNTAVVRWSLREHGVVLAGPDPRRLVDPVTAADLCREVREVLHHWAQQLRAEPEALNNRWRQPHVVLAYCRALHTLDSGIVTSKRAAGQWALGALDPDWTRLIQRALDDRPDPWRRVHQMADPEAVQRTWSFIDYALQVATALLQAPTAAGDANRDSTRPGRSRPV